MHGPHALVKILASKSSNISRSPSLSAVYLTCSDPGLIPNSAFVINFLSTACFAILAALERSSYEELAQSQLGLLYGPVTFLAFELISPTGVARSGVKGPFICGIKSSKLISIN